MKSPSWLTIRPRITVFWLRESTQTNKTFPSPNVAASSSLNPSPLERPPVDELTVSVWPDKVLSDVNICASTGDKLGCAFRVNQLRNF